MSRRQDDYDRNSINATLASIETKIEQKAIVDAERWQKLELWLTAHQSEAKERDRRIGRLENWRFYIVGIATGAGFIVVKLWDWLTAPHGPK